MCSAAHLLFKELCVRGALRSAQVKRSMRWISEFLQLVMPVALLGSLYGPLFLGGALMSSRGWLTPAMEAAVSKACLGELSIYQAEERATADLNNTLSSVDLAHNMNQETSELGRPVAHHCGCCVTPTGMLMQRHEAQQ